MLDRLIDHAALFPPASMPLDVALEEDRAARQSEAAALMGRFVVPARLLRELPDDRPALSVVLAGPEDAAMDSAGPRQRVGYRSVFRRGSVAGG